MAGAGEEANSEKVFQRLPNPLQQQNTISFYLDKPARTNITVYDITGKQVAILVNAQLQAGMHNVTLDAGHWSAGVYTLTMMYDKKVITRKLLKE